MQIFKNTIKFQEILLVTWPKIFYAKEQIFRKEELSNQMKFRPRKIDSFLQILG